MNVYLCKINCKFTLFYNNNVNANKKIYKAINIQQYTINIKSFFTSLFFILYHPNIEKNSYYYHPLHYLCRCFGK